MGNTSCFLPLKHFSLTPRAPRKHRIRLWCSLVVKNIQVHETPRVCVRKQISVKEKVDTPENKSFTVMNTVWAGGQYEQYRALLACLPLLARSQDYLGRLQSNY